MSGRRVVAWVLLAGFVMLILNILIFRVFLEVSAFVYLGIAAYYIIFFARKRNDIDPH